MTLSLATINAKLAKFHPDAALKEFNAEFKRRGRGIYKILFDIAGDPEQPGATRLQAVGKIIELTGAKEFLELGFVGLKELMKRGLPTEVPPAPEEGSAAEDDDALVDSVLEDEEGEPPPPRKKRRAP